MLLLAGEPGVVGAKIEKFCGESLGIRNATLQKYKRLTPLEHQTSYEIHLYVLKWVFIKKGYMFRLWSDGGFKVSRAKLRSR
jgi:hypothetical protein